MARRWRRRGWRRNWRRKDSGDPIEGIVALFALGFIVYAFTHPAQAIIFVSVVITAVIIFFVVRNAKRSKDLQRSIDDYHHAKASPSLQSFDNYPSQKQPTSLTPYQMWRGKKAEWFVQKIAEKFPEDFIALGSLMLSEKGNIDQVIVGPTGVWTIEVKSHAGKITFNGHNLLRNGMPLEKDFLAQAYAEAAVLREYLEMALGRTFKVQPVILFADKNAQVIFGLHPMKGVYVIAAPWFEELLFEQTIEDLDENTVNQVANLFRTLPELPEAPTPIVVERAQEKAATMN